MKFEVGCSPPDYLLTARTLRRQEIEGKLRVSDCLVFFLRPGVLAVKYLSGVTAPNLKLPTSNLKLYQLLSVLQQVGEKGELGIALALKGFPAGAGPAHAYEQRVVPPDGAVVV